MSGKRQKMSLFGLMVMAALSLPAEITANGATFGGEGQVVYPINSNDIELSYEQIFMKFPEAGGIEADCYFHLKNFGPDQEVQIGFPDNRSDWGEEIRTISVYDLNSGTSPQITKKKGKESSERVFVWKTHFKSGEKKLLNVKYNFGLSYADGFPGCRFGYILETGAYWRGPIKKADIYIDFGDKIVRPVLNISPHNYLYTGSRVEWHLENFEPQFNIQIEFGSSEGAEILPEMYYPYQAEIEDDYIWDEVFYQADFWIGDMEEKNNPDYVEWVNAELNYCSDIRNKIYARHGYIFQNQKWADYFAKMPWYKPDPNFSLESLNSIEKRNIGYILKLEKQYRDLLL